MVQVTMTSGTREQLSQQAKKVRADWQAFFPKGYKINVPRLQRQLLQMCEINKHRPLHFPLTTTEMVLVLNWLGYKCTTRSISHLQKRGRFPNPATFDQRRFAWMWEAEEMAAVQAYLEGRRKWHPLHPMHIDKMKSAEIATQLADQRDESWSDEIAHFTLMEITELIAASPEVNVRDYLLQAYKRLWEQRLGEDDADLRFPDDAENN